MYKVFVNDCLIILTDNKKISTNLKKFHFEKVDILKEVDLLFNNKGEGICLLCNDLSGSWNHFQSFFEVQKAAGGKVLNSEKEVLFIYRFSKWDLPKGKLEENESFEYCALREVEEECGVTNLNIVEQLCFTYHLFRRQEKIIFKITNWFLMHTDFEGVLIPQTEEGIEKVVFKDKIETEEALQNSYENIKLLFN
jgi:ADP-ribose pyrophosphatase YjhB (NUDIX family)